MRILDPKFRQNKLNYIGQCVLSTLTIFIVLLVLDAIQEAAIIASLGASAFIAFGMPHAQAARPRYLLGGYAVGIFCGILCAYAAVWPPLAQLPVLQDSLPMVFGALAVGTSIFLMVLLNTEHPPAAGVALGLVLGHCDVMTMLVVAVGILGLTAAKTAMKPYLINLL